MKQKLLLLLTLVLIGKLLHSQIIDRYGVNVGTSYSTQVWDYKLVNNESDNEYRLGLQAFLNTEKDFGRFLALRAEFGYLQKGFKEDVAFSFPNGTTVTKKISDNLILHNLALNLGLKVKPITANYAPYFLIGLRSDYMISHKPVEFEEPNSGKKINMYKSIIEDFNKFNLGGLLGVGIDIKGLIYFEIEYNPNFTKNLDNAELSIKDNCWGAKIGLNINKLTDK